VSAATDPPATTDKQTTEALAVCTALATISTYQQHRSFTDTRPRHRCTIPNSRYQPGRSFHWV